VLRTLQRAIFRSQVLPRIFEPYWIVATLAVRQFKRICNQVQATSFRNCVDHLGVMTIGTILGLLQNGFVPHLNF
jgi:hypothetical protein